MRFLSVLALLPLLFMTSPLVAEDLNGLILEQIKSMPRGGSYAVTREAALNLRNSVQLAGEKRLQLSPRQAQPSYCSGATYLVFLKTLDALQRDGTLTLSPATLQALLIRGQPDGQGIWGRWNANGPGTPRLFHELKLGRNFDDYAKARPGDFMKIFWTREVGKLEHGHSVVFLGLETVGGEESVRFWSSNKPEGYGVKTVPRSRIAYAIFSRLEHPARINNAAALPKADPYLSSLLKVKSSVAEAKAKSGMR